MRVYFVDFWKGFDANGNFFIHRLRSFRSICFVLRSAMRIYVIRIA